MDALSVYKPTGTPLGYPTQQTARLLYSELQVIQTGSLIPEKLVYRLNSLYDPNFTQTGHQPLGFDQWKLFYGYYTVLKCDWEIQIIPTDLTAASAVAVYVSPTSAPSTSVSDLVELGADVVVSNVYQPPHIFTGSIDMARWFKLTPQELVVDDLKRTAVNSNPVDAVYLQLLVAGTSTGSANAVASIRLTFDVVFTVPNVLAPS
jgi:hypothetical protein